MRDFFFNHWVPPVARRLIPLRRRLELEIELEPRGTHSEDHTRTTNVSPAARALHSLGPQGGPGQPVLAAEGARDGTQILQAGQFCRAVVVISTFKHVNTAARALDLLLFVHLLECRRIHCVLLEAM